MSRQLNPEKQTTSSNTSIFSPQAVYFDTRIIGANERIQLLKAPSMESNKIWKNRAFNYAYNRLRAKLCTRTDNEFRPETLITVFSNHFPLSTQNAGHDWFAQMVIVWIKQKASLTKRVISVSTTNINDRDHVLLHL